MLRRTYIFSCLALLTTFSWAQETGENELGSWWIVFATHRISDAFSIHSEVQYRTYEFGSNFNQLLLRTGLNYHFSENSMVTIGYGNIPTDPTFEDIPEEKNSRENRIYQQFLSRQKVGAFQLIHRYRLEQRFLEDGFGNTDTQHRARYALRIIYPINNHWFLTAYDELFINLQEPIFGQNRLYGAVGYKMNDQISFQMGYLKNHFSGRNYDRFQLGAWLNLDYRKSTQEN